MQLIFHVHLYFKMVENEEMHRVIIFLDRNYNGGLYTYLQLQPSPYSPLVLWGLECSDQVASSNISF